LVIPAVPGAGVGEGEGRVAHATDRRAGRWCGPVVWTALPHDGLRGAPFGYAV